MYRLLDLLSNITVQLMSISTHILENEQDIHILINVLKRFEELWHQASMNSLTFNSIVLFKSPVEKLLKACLNLASKKYSSNIGKMNFDNYF